MDLSVPNVAAEDIAVVTVFMMGNVQAVVNIVAHCRHTVSQKQGAYFESERRAAFYIIYYLTTTRKGISRTKLSRKLAPRQKIFWLFKQKSDAAREYSKI